MQSVGRGNERQNHGKGERVNNGYGYEVVRVKLMTSSVILE
jgi:hypothetical protein